MNNEQLTTTQNRSLAECPQVRLQKVLQVGETNEIAFIKNSFMQTPLRKQRDLQTIETLALVLSKSAALIGLKEGIQDFVKDDLKDLIFGKFGGLSLEEIAYAFKLERQRVYHTKTEHYQFFSTEYVADILGKYTQWKAEKRRVHNIDPEPEKQEKKPLSDEEKVLLFFTGLLTDFEDYKERKTLPIGATRHYISLYCLGLLPKHDDHFREQIEQRTLKELQKDMTLTNDRKERSFLKQIIESQMTEEGRFRTKARELILMDFFQKIIDENKNISDVIREKTNGKTHREILEIIRW